MAELAKAQELLWAAWAVSRNCHFNTPPVTQGRLEPVYPVKAAKGQVYNLSFPPQDLLNSCELHTSSEPVPLQLPASPVNKRGITKLSRPILPQGVNAASNQRGAVRLSRIYTCGEGQDNLKHGSS